MVRHMCLPGLTPPSSTQILYRHTLYVSVPAVCFPSISRDLSAGRNDAWTWSCPTNYCRHDRVECAHLGTVVLRDSAASWSDHRVYSDGESVGTGWWSVCGVLTRAKFLLSWQLAFVAGVIVSSCWFTVEGTRTDPNKWWVIQHSPARAAHESSSDLLGFKNTINGYQRCREVHRQQTSIHVEPLIQKVVQYSVYWHR